MSVLCSFRDRAFKLEEIREIEQRNDGGEVM